MKSKNLKATCVRITHKQIEQIKKLKKNYGVTMRQIIEAGIDSFFKNKN